MPCLARGLAGSLGKGRSFNTKLQREGCDADSASCGPLSVHRSPRLDRQTCRAGTQEEKDKDQPRLRMKEVESTRRKGQI
jgi:hypothetical protein